MGEVKTKLTVNQVKTVEDIKNGNFKIPAPKKLVHESSVNIDEFIPMDNAIDDLPFN